MACATSARLPGRKVLNRSVPPGLSMRMHSSMKRDGELNHCTVEADMIASAELPGSFQRPVSASPSQKGRWGSGVGPERSRSSRVASLPHMRSRLRLRRPVPQPSSMVRAPRADILSATPCDSISCNRLSAMCR